MSPCCGRPAQTKGKTNDYYSRYAYMSSGQKQKQLAAVGSQCPTCSALTVGDPCTVCGQEKAKEQTS